jgi:tetratricopeptide (TPR) repeat protein
MNADPNTLFNYAFSLHQRGGVKEAISLYQQLLVQFPNEPQLLAFLGAAWVQLENFEEGVRFLEKSLEIFPDQELVLSNLAFAFHELNRFEDSIRCCDRAIALNLNFAAVHNNRANSLNKVKRFDEALISCNRAIELQPNFTEAYNNRGNILEKLKRFDDALISYEHAIRLNPDYAIAYNNKATLLIELKQFKEALLSCNHAITLKPDFIDAHSNLIHILMELEYFDEALVSCDRALTLKPDSVEVHLNKGNTLNKLNRFDESLTSYENVIVLKPDFAAAHSNRANVLNKLKRFDEALVSCDHAIALNPGFADAYCNKGILFTELKRFDEALVSYDCATDLNPDFSNVHLNKAFISLTLGDFDKGWRLYEWRWQGLLKKQKTFSQPLWLGDASISGKTILIYPEQGLGDIIQMCRYVPMLNALGAKVVLEVPVSLVSVVSTLKGDFDIVEKGTVLPNFDVQCPIMSLPLALKTTVDTIPAEIPYLFSDPAKQKVWKERLGTKTKPRIGFVCSGSTTHNDDSKRSIPLDLFNPLFELPLEFHMLQKEIRPDDQKVLELFPHIQTHQEYLVDFSDTAALIEEMDLVVSVDTSVVHLAGALGKPVWVLISWVPDFRWLLDRTDSPWYSTATLFRQTELGNWVGVIEKVCQKLKGQYLNEH